MVERGYRKIIQVPREMGHELDSNSRILDLGCGNGDIVESLRGYGFQVFGCDLMFKDGVNVEHLSAEGVIKKIQQNPYKLPYEDNYFDYVFSTQVFEHVQDYPSTLVEVHRVMKDGGASIHEFPARYRPIEIHVFVPFAGVITSYWWLLFWAKLGIRKKSQANLSAAEVALENHKYLINNTTYYTKSEITQYVSKWFGSCYFCELEAAKYSRLERIYRFVKYIPLLSSILSAFQTRVIYFKK